MTIVYSYRVLTGEITVVTFTLTIEIGLSENIYTYVHLRWNGTPPLFDVLSFEINNENYFL